MFQHILVPLDGSERAEQALPVAMHLAKASGGSLLLLRVVSPFNECGMYATGIGAAAFLQGAVDQALTKATAYLAHIAHSPEMEAIETHVVVYRGQAASSILDVAREQEIDLIVLCSHGYTGFKRWALGRVAHALVHQCPIPLLVLCQRAAPFSRSSFAAADQIRTLVPLDGSPLAEAALGPAAHLTAVLAAPGQGALHLVQVVKIFPTTAEEGFVSELNEEALQRAGTYLDRIEEHLDSTVKDLRLSLTHSTELASDTASTLVSLAEHGKGEEGNTREQETERIDACDLIAISTHGRGGLERWVMGSVAERLLQTTTLPVLVVRPSKEG